MEIKDLIQRAVEVRAKYNEQDKIKWGVEWTPANVAQGFVSDVGDLMKLIMAKDGIRKVENLDEKLAHELADCLYSIFVLASKYDVDLEKSFLKTMDELEKRISQNDD